MKRKTGLSLIMALLMILSTLVVVTPSGASSEIFVVEKQVSDGEGWCDSINAVYGDIVQFKITITYNGEHCAENIVATDTLPPCLEYVKTLEPENIVPTINGNILVWDLGETCLEQYCSTCIIFEAKVVGIGENVNTVNVTAVECCPDHNIYGVDTATVIVDSSVNVEKKVWDPEAKVWVDELCWVIKGQNVRFQITSTYHGDISMRCMLVTDCLPECCFEYANNVLIKIAGEEINENDDAYPDITVTEDILFDWRNADLYLENGESVVIEFDAKVINYCEDTVTNWAGAFLWGCYLCNQSNYVFDCDSAIVQCYPHDPIFEKTVWNGEQWVEKANVYVNDTIKYKIDLTYYGIDNLTDIKIMDELPCVLKHVDEDATLTVFNNNVGHIGNIATDISENKKTAWWNLTDELEDGDTLSIVFNVLVTGATGDCCDCEECGINTASYVAHNDEKQYAGSDTAKIVSTHKTVPPLKISIQAKRFSIGRIVAKICYTGEKDTQSIVWNITVNSKRQGFILESTGTIDNDSCVTISTGKRSIKHMFGRITVKITVTVGDEKFEENFKGFVLGRLVRLRPVA